MVVFDPFSSVGHGSSVEAGATLTAEGHALIERGVDELLCHEESLLASLSEDQRSDRSGLLRILLDGLGPRRS